MSSVTQKNVTFRVICLCQVTLLCQTDLLSSDGQYVLCRRAEDSELKQEPEAVAVCSPPAIRPCVKFISQVAMCAVHQS